MTERDMEEWMARLRDDYNPPPETPREEMWAAIEKRLDTPFQPEAQGIEPSAADDNQPGAAEHNVARAAEDIVPIEKGRRPGTVSSRPFLSWAAAAAAILVIGLGIGRMTAPGAPTAPGVPGVRETPSVASATADSQGASVDPLRLAAMEHLLRTESLLTLARADANAGRVETGLGDWSRKLLTQTRLLLDAHDGTDPVLKSLLEDLELILVQLVGAANAHDGNSIRTRTEMNLALEGLEDSEVLSRIRSVLPAGPRFAGT